MRKSTILCGLIAAFMCLAQNVNAQYLPAHIHRDGANFIDETGVVLSDQELVEAVGADIFHDTVIGARKQYNAGRKLIVSGVAGCGVGLLGFLGGVAMIAAAGPDQKANGEVYFENDGLAAAGGGVVVLGGVAMTLAGVALSAGIPLKVIGQSRLNWVENDYNGRSRDLSLHVGSTPSGVGLTLSF